MKGRIKSYEGIRGIMSIAILNCHVIPGLFPLMVKSSVWKNFCYTPLSIFVSGGFGVSYFFVLSSFGLCYSNYNKEWKLIILGCIKRYFRLLPTLMMSDLVAFILFKNRWYYLVPGNLEDTSMLRFDVYQGAVKGISNVIKDSIWDVFIYGSSYVAPFWTIKLEIRAGIIILCFILAVRNRKYIQKLIAFFSVCIGVGFLNSAYYYSTIMGAILYISYHYLCGRQNERKKKKQSKYWLWATLIVFWLIVLWSYSSFNLKINYTYFCGIGWMMLMIWLLFNKNSVVEQFLMSRPISKLGKISFQIYGLHYLVMCSFGCFLINRFHANNNILYGMITYFMVVGLTIVLAYIMNWIDSLIQHHIVDKIFYYVESVIF